MTIRPPQPILHLCNDLQRRVEGAGLAYSRIVCFSLEDQLRGTTPQAQFNQRAVWRDPANQIVEDGWNGTRDGLL